MNHKTNFLNRLEKNNLLVFLCFFGVAFILRFHTFIPITLDRDEATYAVFADHLLNGSELYKDVQDIKPPGIFLIYSFIQLVFGKSLIVIRLMSMLIVSSAAYFLYLFKRNIGCELIPSALTGVIYILMFNYFFGLSGNTELYFIWCFALGLLVYQRAEGIGGYLMSGLIIGAGFIIKQHVAFDFAALGLAFLITSIMQKTFLANFWKMFFMVVGFVLPYVLVHCYFYLNGNWESYYYVTYVAPTNYSAEHDLVTSLRFNFGAIVMYSPFILMGILSWKQAHLSPSFRLLILLLIVFDLTAVNITGKPFKHYLLQLAIPISLIAGEAYGLPYVKRVLNHGIFHKVAAGLVLLYALVLGIVYQEYRFDSARELVAYFEDKLTEEDTIYAADSPNILYWYFDKRSPTKYIHSTLMVFDHHIEELQIDIPAELGRILEGNPTYIIISDRYPHQWFVTSVKTRYDQVADLNKYSVYKIKP